MEQVTKVNGKARDKVVPSMSQVHQPMSLQSAKEHTSLPEVTTRSLCHRPHSSPGPHYHMPDPTGNGPVLASGLVWDIRERASVSS